MLVFTFLGVPGAVLWFSLAAYNQLGDHTSDPIESGGRGAAQPTPQWSPDGSLIVFTRDGSLHTVTADGSHLQPIRQWTGDRRSSRAQSPSISPDGSRMAFTAFEHNTWLPWDKDHQWEIVTSALDGSDERRVTKTGNRGILNLNPVWSPDGTRIAFTSNRVNSEPDGEEAPVGKYGIFTMAPDGSDASRVAPSLSVKGSNPVWSPDGRSLAFVATEPGEGFRVFKDVLYVVGSDGSGLTRIGEAISWLTWSPDSSRIAFVGTDGVEVALHTVAPDGSDPTRVLGLRDVDMVPFGNLSWAPDGASILLSGGRKVVVVDADGSGLQLEKGG